GGGGGGNGTRKSGGGGAGGGAGRGAAGVGIDRVLLWHDGSTSNSDLFQGVLTMLDPQVALGLLPVVPAGSDPLNGHGVVHQDEERARQLGRPLHILKLTSADGPAIVERARADQYDLIILPLPPESPTDPVGRLDERSRFILRHAHCRVFLATTPGIPQEVVDSTPSVS